MPCLTLAITGRKKWRKTPFLWSVCIALLGRRHIDPHSITFATVDELPDFEWNSTSLFFIIIVVGESPSLRICCLNPEVDAELQNSPATNEVTATAAPMTVSGADARAVAKEARDAGILTIRFSRESMIFRKLLGLVICVFPSSVTQLTTHQSRPVVKIPVL